MRLLAGVLISIVVGAAALAPSAGAAAYPPPSGKVFTGLTGAISPADFAGQVGKPPAVLGSFTQWGGPLESIFSGASAAGARVMLHVGTNRGYGTPEKISPGEIASGRGDDYLLALNHRIAASGDVVYVRFLAEMNQANNAYSAYTPSGHFKGKAHSPAMYKQAFRRAALILRGGPVAAIDARLRALHLPPVQGAAADAILEQPKVAMFWCPQVAGTPDIAANSAQAYYPGDAYVDWVGTDFYSKFPNFNGLQRFYAEHPRKPFAFGEWAIWGGDNPGFVHQLFDFINSHRRVRMALYNAGQRSDGPFQLRQFPQARAAIRHELAGARFVAGPGR